MSPLDAARAALEALEDSGHKDDLMAAADALRTAIAAAEKAEPAPRAMQQLTAALQSDPDYAWAWHCNLAMPVMDATGATHRVANEAGARLMRHLFDIDITKHPHYHVDDASPAAPAVPLTDWQLGEIERQWDVAGTGRLKDFARAIERAHGIGDEP